jgi:hypothetical protein
MSWLSSAESIAKIVGVSIACFGIYTYWNDIKLKKIERSYGVVDTYTQNAVVQGAQSAIAKFSNSVFYDPEYTNYKLDQYNAIVLNGLRFYRNDTDTVSDFFNRAYTCGQSDLCDLETLRKLLKDDATQMHFHLYPLINEWQKSGNHKADGIIFFSSK